MLVSSTLIKRNAELSADDLDGWWLSHGAKEASEKGNVGPALVCTSPPPTPKQLLDPESKLFEGSP